MKHVVIILVILATGFLVMRTCFDDTAGTSQPQQRPQQHDEARTAVPGTARSVQGRPPTLHGVPPLQVRRGPQDHDEGIGAYHFRMQWTAAYDAFLKELGPISPEQEQAILRIFADAQENIDALNHEGDGLGSDAVMYPNPENEERYWDYLRYGIPLTTDVHEESKERLRELLDERGMRAYMKHLFPAEIWWALEKGMPIQSVP